LRLMLRLVDDERDFMYNKGVLCSLCINAFEYNDDDDEMFVIVLYNAYMPIADNESKPMFLYCDIISIYIYIYIYIYIFI
jgi:hypothetical protein